MINELVSRLSKGKHQLIIGHRDESYAEIKDRIQNGYIHIKFTDTKGGTEIGINVDLQNTNLEDLDFETGKGILHIEGTSNLNYNSVRCIADIDLATRKGKGHLKITEKN